jgi:hypothetical protein
MMKESTAHCKAVLFLLCSCFGLLLVMWVNQLFYLASFNCTCLPYGFLCLRSVDVLNVLVGAGVCCMAVSHHGCLS